MGDVQVDMNRNVKIETGHGAYTEETQYRVMTSAPKLARSKQPSSGFGAQLTATLTIAVGMVALGCAVISGDAHTLVAGNPLAESALRGGGIDAIIAFRTATLAFALAMIVTGVRLAGVSMRTWSKMRRIPLGLQAITSGLLAANLALIAWWTAWLFV